MGIGRREFLAAFGTILARLAIARSPAAVCEENLYLNRRFGIALRCPPAWDFIRLEGIGEVQQGQLLAVDDVEQNKAILGSVDLPFVALSPRHNAHTCVQMYLASPPDETDIVHELMKAAFDRPNAASRETGFSGPMRIIRRDWQIARGLLKAFKVTHLATELSVSNCLAAEYTANYDFEHEQLETPRPVTVRTVAIEHNPRYYLLRLICDASTPCDLSAFMESVCLI